MPDTVLIIYDCPLKKCDKLWLKEELEKRNYQVKTVAPVCRISHIEQRGRMGKILSRFITLWQCLKGMVKSKRGETVICWSQWSGILFNALPGADKRYIISYNWLTPVPNGKTKHLYAKALQNPKLTAIINSPETKKRILNDYEVTDIGNIVCIPDVFDDKEAFLPPEYKSKEKYCFSGGRANRDWKLLMKIAALCPDIMFQVVAAKADWDDKLKIPDNVKLFFDVEPEKYYCLLKHSYMAAYPLKEDRVSGLINILKAIQLGKPVLTTGISFTELYFPNVCKDYLIEFGDTAEWKKEIDNVWNYERKDYEEKVEQMQLYVKEKFSPHMAGKTIDSVIKGRK